MNNKKNIIILFLSLLLLGVFLYQGKVIKDFSKEPERVEVIFKSDDPLIESILEEVEFIEEKYVMKSTSLGESLIRLDLEKPENIEDEFFKDRLLDYMSLKVGSLFEGQALITDYSNTNMTVRVWNEGIKLLIAIQLFIILVILFLRRARTVKSSLESKLKDYYLEDIVKDKINEILEETIKLLIILFISLFLLKYIIDFQFSLAGSNLPAENIFDWDFYRSLKTSINMDLSEYGEYYYMTLSKVKRLWLAFFLLSNIVIIEIVKKITNKREKGEGNNGKLEI